MSQPSIQIIPIEKATDLSTINYSFGQNNWGNFLIASTSIGLCHLSFGSNQEGFLLELKKTWTSSHFLEKATELHLQVKTFLEQKTWPEEFKELKLNLYGTDFQLQVWQALLNIPFGQTRTYSQIAQ